MNTIEDFNHEYRNILEQGVNLLRYGFDEEMISSFFKAVKAEPEMAEFINKNMNTWGPGFEYERGQKLTVEFLDTINFIPFLETTSEVETIIEMLRDECDDSIFLPDGAEGNVLHDMSDEEFGLYLKRRYNERLWLNGKEL